MDWRRLAAASPSVAAECRRAAAEAAGGPSWACPGCGLENPGPWDYYPRCAACHAQRPPAHHDVQVRRVRGNERVLYHQTGRDAHDVIIEKGKMLRGSRGLAGGGIYFADNPADTEHKAAHEKGWIIQARVSLGRSKEVHWQDSLPFSFRELAREGHDSVVITGRRGMEYVVYNYDQVEVLDSWAVSRVPAAVRDDPTRVVVDTPAAPPPPGRGVTVKVQTKFCNSCKQPYPPAGDQGQGMWVMCPRCTPQNVKKSFGDLMVT